MGGSESPNCLGAVMAGGLGRRMGGAKATVELAGRPLISYPLAAVEAAGLHAVVIAKAGSELPPLDVPLVTESAEPRHPLVGIVAALEEAALHGAPAALIVACDMPLLPPELIAWLAALDEPLALPLIDGHPQPLAARYSTDLLPALRQTLTGQPDRLDSPTNPGQPRIGPLTRIVMDLGPRLLTEAELAGFGDPRQMLHNVNTAADLERATGWLPA